MGDYARELYLDPTVTIKTEPILSDGSSLMITSASVPIPSRPDYRDYDNSQSPVYPIFSEQLLQLPDSALSWGVDEDTLKSEALIHMDDDDIFQVDKADLIQGPTLAELNANDENLLGDLNFDDLLLPEESSKAFYGSATVIGNFNNNQANSAASSLPNTPMFFYRELEGVASSVPTVSAFDQKTPISTLSPNSPTSSNSSLPHSGTSPLHITNIQQKHSTLHELLMKREVYDGNQLGQSVPSRNTLVSPPNTKSQKSISRLSSSAPTHLGLDQIWQRREPRKHLLSTSSLAEAGSTSSLSTGGVLSPDPQDFSHDEFDSDDDSDAHYEDYSSDNDSEDEREPGAPRSHPSKKERFFWQYNVQAKGPKGQRLVMKSKMEDPHVLHEVTDPVFSPDCSVRGIKHSGKARKGDGNDLTPNARKLYAIGRELDKLGRVINDMTPVSELPFNVRPTSRKEKNKLASRACRLKKKAQHEANKIKLSGLETEHKRLLGAIAQTKQILAAKMGEQNAEKQEEMTRTIEKLMKSATKFKVAGRTTEYVNKVLDKAKNGGMTVLLEDM